MANKNPADLAKHIAKRLTTLRLQKTWTREQLAAHSGVNVHTLKHFERTGQISFERLIAICFALELIHEIERLFKPRHRVNIDNWQINIEPTRQRGRRQHEKHFVNLMIDEVES